MSLANNRYRTAKRIYNQWLRIAPDIDKWTKFCDFTHLHIGKAKNTDTIDYEFHPDAYEFHGNHNSLPFKVAKLSVRFRNQSSSPITAKIINYPGYKNSHAKLLLLS